MAIAFKFHMHLNDFGKKLFALNRTLDCFPKNFLKIFPNTLIWLENCNTMGGLWEVQASSSDFQKTSSCRGIQNKVQSVMASLHCYENCDVNITLVITNFDLYLIQLWRSFCGSIVNGDVVNAQT